MKVIMKFPVILFKGEGVMQYSSCWRCCWCWLVSCSMRDVCSCMSSVWTRFTTSSLNCCWVLSSLHTQSISPMKHSRRCTRVELSLTSAERMNVWPLCSFLFLLVQLLDHLPHLGAELRVGCLHLLLTLLQLLIPLLQSLPFTTGVD